MILFQVPSFMTLEDKKVEDLFLNGDRNVLESKFRVRNSVCLREEKHEERPGLKRADDIKPSMDISKNIKNYTFFC